MQQHDLGDAQPMSPYVAAPSQPVATPTPTSDHAATTARHRYTMTVEDVGSRLHTYGLDRDSRTIQRWCKSGRVEAILDHENGERWLIDPATLEPVIDDMQKEMSRQPKPFAPTPRRNEPVVGDTVHAPRHSLDTERENVPDHGDLHHDAATTPGHSAATSAPVGDNDAALKKRVSDLELENVHLKADKQARELLNEYMKEQFESMIETALDRTEEIGRLRAENAALQQALPQAESQPRFTEQVRPPNHEHSDEFSNAVTPRTEAIDNTPTWQGTRRV